MKPKIQVLGIAGLLLFLVGCGQPIKESRLIGAWQFDVEHSIMVLDTNHTFTLRSEKGDASGLIGDWHLQGGRLIIVGHTWTDGSNALRTFKTNDTTIAELSDTRMVLQNWGGPVSSLTKVVSSH